MTEATPSSRVCTKCGLDKPLSDFHKAKGSKFGVYPSCRDCKRALERARREADPEVDRERQRQWRKANAEHVRTRERERRASKDPETVRAERRATYQRNAERERESRRKYYAANSDKAKATTRAWVQANPEKAAEYVRRYRATNPKIRTVLNQNRRAKMGGKQVSRSELDALDKSRCGICGEGIDNAFTWPHPESASVDHIIPLGLGGAHEIGNLQWAHLACNMRKGARTS